MSVVFFLTSSVIMPIPCQHNGLNFHPLPLQELQMFLRAFCLLHLENFQRITSGFCFQARYQNLLSSSFKLFCYFIGRHITYSYSSLLSSLCLRHSVSCEHQNFRRLDFQIYFFVNIQHSESQETQMWIFLSRYLQILTIFQDYIIFL